MPSGISGIAGYSYSFTQYPYTLPDGFIETENPVSVRYSDCTDGIWYFHVRAIDNAGNFGVTSHYTINVDTFAPITTLEPLLQNAANNSVRIEITAVDDYSSGANEFSNVNYIDIAIEQRIRTPKTPSDDFELLQPGLWIEEPWVWQPVFSEECHQTEWSYWVEEPGLYRMKYFSVDNADNVETLHVSCFRVGPAGMGH